MKKIMAYNKTKKLFYLFIVVCLILFNSILILSCGLETFYFINPPTVPSNFQIPNAGTDHINRTFKFDTTEVNQPDSGLQIVGTEIWYKIYLDRSSMDSETQSINKLINLDKDNSTSKSADKITDRNYKQLNFISGTSRDEAIIRANQLASVEIRLNDSHLSENPNDYPQFQQHVHVNGVPLDVIPVRYNGKSFDFREVKNRPNALYGASPDADVLPISSLSNEPKYYVSMYAITKGHSSDMSNKYSRATYIGTILIDSSTPIN